MLAARLAIEGMVEELLSADTIDVNATDEYGKTALHWAAAVNNVTASLALLRHGANKDAQDARDQTPLFLAAREGSYEVARALLDHLANRDMTDHMDRLPRDMAQERFHQDIVKLLEEYHVDSPMGFPNTYTTTPEAAMASYIHQVSVKKPRKRTPKNGHRTMNGGGVLQMKDSGAIPHSGQVVRLPPVGHKPRGSKKKKLCETQTSPEQKDVLHKTSPLDPLESPENAVDIPPSYKEVCPDGIVMSEDEMQMLGNMVSDALSNQTHGGFPDSNLSSDLLTGVEELSPESWFSDLPPASVGSNTMLGGGSHNLPPNGSPLVSSPLSNKSPLSNSSSLTQNYSPYSMTQSPALSSQSMCSMASSPHYPLTTSPNQTSPLHNTNQGVMSPPKHSLPLSPTHMQAIRQHAQKKHATQPPSSSQTLSSSDSYSLPRTAYDNNGIVISNTPNNTAPTPNEHYCQQQQALSVGGPTIGGSGVSSHHHHHHHYPTPPSQHSQLSTESTPHDLASLLPDHYLTPSPDSPGQWSSSSPHSAQSDWSEGMSSPPQNKQPRSTDIASAYI